jgi:hypothetical protein
MELDSVKEGVVVDGVGVCGSSAKGLHVGLPPDREDHG